MHFPTTHQHRRTIKMSKNKVDFQTENHQQPQKCRAFLSVAGRDQEEDSHRIHSDFIFRLTLSRLHCATGESVAVASLKFHFLFCTRAQSTSVHDFQFLFDSNCKLATRMGFMSMVRHQSTHNYESVQIFFAF